MAYGGKNDHDRAIADSTRRSGLIRKMPKPTSAEGLPSSTSKSTTQPLRTSRRPSRSNREVCITSFVPAYHALGEEGKAASDESKAQEMGT